MNILVTGAAGFVGSHLTDYLINRGDSVIAVDNLITGNKENLKEALKTDKCVFYEVDVNNYSEIKDVFELGPIDYVFHFAALTGVIRTQEDPIAVLEDINGIKNILELSSFMGIKKVIYSSSSEVYGDPEEVSVAESGRISPGLTYAAVKFMGEKFLEGYRIGRGLDYSCLRFFNVYGPRQNYSPYGFVVGIFIERALSGCPLQIFGDGTATRDFTYINDAVSAAVSAMENSETSGRTINVGTGRSISVYELAEQVIRITSSESKIEILPPRESDIRHRLANTDLMKKIFNNLPSYNLEKGLEETVDWYQKYLVTSETFQ